jgi:hypothetical protein
MEWREIGLVALAAVALLLWVIVLPRLGVRGG